MKQINFVPVAVRTKAAQQHILPYLSIAGLVALIAVGGAWMGVGIVRGGLNDQLATLQKSEAEKKAAAEKDQKDLNVDADLINRVNQINTLAKADINWERAFAYINSLLPQDVTLSSYTLGGGTTPAVVLKMVGEAPSNVSFATMVKSFQQNKELKDFTVDGYNYTPGKGTVSFTITVTLPKDKLVYVTPKS